MANDITVAAEPRTLRGKNEARRLRAAGSAPAVVYGIGKDAVAVAVNPKEMVRILRSKTGHNTIFHLAIKDGENTPVMIVDWQRDPVKDTILHIDMKRIDLTRAAGGEGPGAHRGRAGRRQAPGRIARSDHPRNRSSSACRTKFPMS